MAYHEYSVESIIAMRDRVQHLANDFDRIVQLIREQKEDGIYAQLNSFNVYMPRIEEQVNRNVVSAERMGVKHVPHRLKRGIEKAPDMGGKRPKPAKKAKKATKKKRS